MGTSKLLLGLSLCYRLSTLLWIEILFLTVCDMSICTTGHCWGNLTKTSGWGGEGGEQVKCKEITTHQYFNLVYTKTVDIIAFLVHTDWATQTPNILCYSPLRNTCRKIVIVVRNKQVLNHLSGLYYLTF